MSPANRYYSLLAGTTVIIMFWLITFVSPFFSHQSNINIMLVSLGSFLATAGTYRLLTLLLHYLMEHCEYIKRRLLGPRYMQGTWVGCFIGHGGDKRYMVEHYIQDFETLVISGISFTDMLVSHGLWTSDYVLIDERKGVISFTYTFEVLTNKASLMGVHKSLFERPSSYSPPTATNGFAHDLRGSDTTP